MEKQYLLELISGKRISLRKHTVELADKMYQYVVEDRERLARFLPWPKFINSVDDEIDFINKCSQSWDNQTSVHYGIYRNSDDEYMGNISSFDFDWSNHTCEIGYWILGKFEGQGYMSEAVTLLEQNLYQTGFNRIVIQVDPQNERSGSIPKRLNYSYEGTLRDAAKVNDAFRNLEVYSKIQSDQSERLAGEQNQRSNQYSISEIIHSGEIYDHINQFDFDLYFYKKWARSVNGNVLELCCGTGRLTIPLAQNGVNITGLDISTSMLEKANEKSVDQNQTIDFIQGDITNFDLKKQFDLIFIPFNSFQCIYSIEDVEKVFSCIQKHMKEDGVFILDIFNPSIELMVARKDEWRKFKEFSMSEGRSVLIEEMCQYDSAGQVNRVKWKHTMNGKEQIEQLDMRCFYPLEMDALLKYNGFNVLHKFGDFEENVFELNSKKQIFICKRN